MKIEDLLRACVPVSPPAELRLKVLAASGRWRPWYLAAAAVTLFLLVAANLAIESRLQTPGRAPSSRFRTQPPPPSVFDGLGIPWSRPFFPVSSADRDDDVPSWKDLWRGRLP